MMETTTRNAGLPDLVEMLRTQHVRKVDMVVPAQRLRSIEGQMQVTGVDTILMDDGVMDPNGLYVPTAVFDEGVADKMGIPLSYVRRLRSTRPDLMDANINGWLHGRKPKMRGEEVVREAIPGDDRSFLFRSFRSDGVEPGIARALLSDRFSIVDNLDVLMAVLDGLREAGTEVEIVGADLSERRMVVRVKAPEVKALAPALLAGYRSPFSGNSGDENPTVFAGFQISNSETGGGAFQIVPRLIVEVCDNGMTITKDAVRQVHLGGRLDAGLVKWSEETQQQNIALIRSKTRDTVQTFLDVDYMKGVIEAAEKEAGREIEKVDEVKVLAKRLKFSEAEQDGILEHFVRGGQMTRGGLLNAITSFAQTVDDADAAFEMEGRALQALSV